MKILQLPKQFFCHDLSCLAPDFDSTIFSEVQQQIWLEGVIWSKHCLTFRSSSKHLVEDYNSQRTAVFNFMQHSHVETSAMPFILFEGFLQWKYEHKLFTCVDGSWAAWQKSFVFRSKYPF